MDNLVFQTDFGTVDGAVSAMYGVALGVDADLRVYDLTHEITPYDIWEASYRLIQTVGYWRPGTVFVSVVDPGVGSSRRSVAVKTRTGHYILTPDNGTLTHVKRLMGIESAVLIDEETNRLPNSGESYTFHGRDVYAFTGARLASGKVKFEDIGDAIDPESIVEVPVVEPSIEGEWACGTIDVLDVRFGSLWTNVPRAMFRELDIHYGDKLEICIRNDTRTIYRNILSYATSFSEVYVGEPLVYINSLDCAAVAINQGSFSKAYNIGTGTSWRISFRKVI